MKKLREWYDELDLEEQEQWDKSKTVQAKKISKTAPSENETPTATGTGHKFAPKAKGNHAVWGISGPLPVAYQRPPAARPTIRQQSTWPFSREGRENQTVSEKPLHSKNSVKHMSDVSLIFKTHHRRPDRKGRENQQEKDEEKAKTPITIYANRELWNTMES